MKDKLKKQLQCQGCDMPFCDIKCNDLSDETIEWIIGLANKRVIDELESVLNRTDKGSILEEHLIARIEELKK